MDRNRSCPSPETLATFVDGRLDRPSRNEVTGHLDRCPVCREIAAETLPVTVRIGEESIVEVRPQRGFARRFEFDTNGVIPEGLRDENFNTDRLFELDPYYEILNQRMVQLSAILTPWTLELGKSQRPAPDASPLRLAQHDIFGTS